MNLRMCIERGVTEGFVYQLELSHFIVKGRSVPSIPLSPFVSVRPRPVPMTFSNVLQPRRKASIIGQPAPLKQVLTECADDSISRPWWYSADGEQPRGKSTTQGSHMSGG